MVHTNNVWNCANWHWNRLKDRNQFPFKAKSNCLNMSKFSFCSLSYSWRQAMGSTCCKENGNQNCWKWQYKPRIFARLRSGQFHKSFGFAVAGRRFTGYQRESRAWSSIVIWNRCDTYRCWIFVTKIRSQRGLLLGSNMG